MEERRLERRLPNCFGYDNQTPPGEFEPKVNAPGARHASEGEVNATRSNQVHIGELDPVNGAFLAVKGADLVGETTTSFP